MIRVELTNVHNGLVKKIVDTQFNGDDQFGEITKIYEFSDDDIESNQEKTVQFLIDLTKDLAIDLGSDHTYKMKFIFDWGSRYNPSLQEVNERIRRLSHEIKSWKSYRKAIENHPNANIR
jgi:hypothetical protein